MWRGRGWYKSLSIPSRIILLFVAPGYIAYPFSFNSIKDYRRRSACWDLPMLRRTFNSIKDYLRRSKISKLRKFQDLSIPSRIIEIPQFIIYDVFNKAFNSIKDYQVRFVTFFDREFEKYFQFHQGLSRLNKNAILRVWSFQFHQGLSKTITA